MRENWTYRDYLKETTIGMITSWSRIHYWIDDFIAGIKAFAALHVLLVLPFLFFLSPVVALVSRTSDRATMHRIAKAREEAQRRIHKWGPGVVGHEGKRNP